MSAEGSAAAVVVASPLATAEVGVPAAPAERAPTAGADCGLFSCCLSAPAPAEDVAVPAAEGQAAPPAAAREVAPPLAAEGTGQPAASEEALTAEASPEEAPTAEAPPAEGAPPAEADCALFSCCLSAPAPAEEIIVPTAEGQAEVPPTAAEAVSLPPTAVLYLKDADRKVRMRFVRKVYCILFAQLCLTDCVAWPFQLLSQETVADNMWVLVASSVVLLGTFCFMACCGNTYMRAFPTNYILLFVLTSSTGVIVGFTSAVYTWQSVFLAGCITVWIFLCMTAFAWLTPTDFTGSGPYCVALLMSMIWFACAISILSLFGANIQWAAMLYNFLGVLLFTFYIVYDTQVIIGGSHKVEFTVDDYCFAALNLYLDMMNLVLCMLRILGVRSYVPSKAGGTPGAPASGARTHAAS